MAPRKRKQPIPDLVSIRNNMEALKELVVSLGMPYTHVRRMDDALVVISRVEARLEKLDNGKQKA